MVCVQLLQKSCVIVQMELGTYPEPIQAVLQKLLAAASPTAPVPMHWRYSLMSLAVFLFIMPPVDAASAKVCTACFMTTVQGLSSYTGVSCPHACQETVVAA